jgi:hypothetical protein
MDFFVSIAVSSIEAFSEMTVTHANSVEENNVFIGSSSQWL